MRTYLDIGTLDQRVAIQQDVAAVDALGGQGVPSWTTVTPDVWARVEPLSGAERVAAQAVTATTQYRVYLRYRADITTRMRVLWDDLSLQIQSVIRLDGQKVFLVLDCTAVT